MNNKCGHLLYIIFFGLFVNQVRSQPLNHISFTQPVGDGITYQVGTGQTLSWTMACTPPSTLVSENPTMTEVHLYNSDDTTKDSGFIGKVGTIDCTKSVGNMEWKVPSDCAPGVYYLMIVLTPNNAYSGRFNIVGGNA